LLSKPREKGRKEKKGHLQGRVQLYLFFYIYKKKEINLLLLGKQSCISPRHHGNENTKRKRKKERQTNTNFKGYFHGRKRNFSNVRD
jgi:hypothetical protein